MVRGLGKRLQPLLPLYKSEPEKFYFHVLCIFSFYWPFGLQIQFHHKNQFIEHLVIYISCQCQNKCFFKISISYYFFMNSFNLDFQSFTFLIQSVFHNIFPVLFSSWSSTPEKLFLSSKRGFIPKTKILCSSLIFPFIQSWKLMYNWLYIF